MTRPERDLAALQERLGYTFDAQELLQEALTHKSFAEENPGLSHNERLEFLGDAAADLVVARGLFLRHPQLAEGGLTKRRSALVDRSALSIVGRALELDSFMWVGAGEQKEGSRATREGNCVEALVGAMLLDGGYDRADQALSLLLVDCWDLEPLEKPKTALSELSQELFGGQTPKYFHVKSWGPDNRKSHSARVELPDGREFVGEAEATEQIGRKKKDAERAAAAVALEALRGEG